MSTPFDTPARTRRRHPGFTLLELIVVIVVLGVLAAIAIPTFSGVISRSNDAASAATLQAVVSDAKALYAINQGSTFTDWYTAFATAVSEVPSASSLNLAAPSNLTVNVDVPDTDPAPGSIYVSAITASGVSAAGTGASTSKTQVSIGLDLGSGIFGLANKSSSGNCVLATFNTNTLAPATAWSEKRDLGSSCSASVAVKGEAADLSSAAALATVGGVGGPVVPSATANLTVNPNDSSNLLFWTPVLPTPLQDVTGYTLQQSVGAATGPWTTIYSGPDLTYTDAPLVNGTTYYYRIAATNSIGVGTYSSVVSAAPSVPDGATSAPTASTTILTPTHAPVIGSLISFPAVSDIPGSPVDGYYLQSAPSALGPWSTVQTFPASPLYQSGSGNYSGWFADGPPGTTVYYRVAAYNSMGLGPYSDTLTDTMFQILQPLTLTVVNTSPGDITIHAAYNPANGPATNIYYDSFAYLGYSNSPAGPWSAYSSFASAYQSGSDTTIIGLAAGTQYYFKDHNTNANGFPGPDSAIITASTVASSGGPATAPVLSSPSSGSITWTAVIPLTDAASTGYIYEYAKAVDSSAPADSITGLWSIPTTTPASSAGQLIGGPTGYIRVAAYTPAGLGPWSNIVYS